ncbi:UbiD family decarboxylase [Thiotrichales bacterium 19X7-9]|nr:UbiD family decarboxylase [Thiotrichales bacterium 19X7-9]
MKDLRQWLDYLDNKSLLKVMKPGIDLRYELIGVLEKVEGKYACLFPKPSNHPVPVVAGTLQRRSWVAHAMGVKPEQMLQHFSYAMEHPIPWDEVSQDQAPVHEVIHKDNIDIKKLLPIVTHHEKDAGPYVTSGLVSGLNLQTGKQNLSINRMQVMAPDKLGILMLPRDLHAYYVYAEKVNQPLPVTITIGHEPLTELSSQAIAKRDQCELEIAGALHQKPLSVVKSYTNEVRVPANAEISIEGHIFPHLRALEGPFGEFPKYYTGQDMLPVIQISCITHRKNPIYKTSNPSGIENIAIGGVSREASILQRIQVNFPTVIDLRLTPGGLGRYHIVVKVAKTEYGLAKNIIACAFGCHYDIKQVIVVDADIDIDDPEHIEWAIATRFQAQRDLVVINQALGSKLDPSAKAHGLSSKLGLDATKYLGDENRFYVSKVPHIDQIHLDVLVDQGSNFLKSYLS